MLLKFQIGHFCSILVLAIAPFTTLAQTAYKQTGKSYITISGTSTLNDWTMTTTDAKCLATFEISSTESPSKVNSLTITMKSESLKSGHPAMDRNAYSTLKTENFKTITFALISSTISDNQIQCVGNLTVAGVMKEIQVDASIKAMPDKSLFVAGSKKFLMSDFGITPPTFMFETVSTGDEVKISFNMELVPAKK
jgi:hypothetical protein